MAAGDLPVQKVTISGATLASIIQRFASSPGDTDGLLFGHVTRLPPPPLLDDDPSPLAAAPPPLAATITGHFSSGTPTSFRDPLGRINARALRLIAGGARPIGWFSARRASPLRPSMMEHAASLSLSKTLTLTQLNQNPTPLVFLLLSSSATQNLAVHTHEYRAFVLRPGGGGSLVPCSLEIVNLGPAFRGQYDSFSPSSRFPFVPCEGEGEMVGESVNTKSIGFVKQSARDQQLLDASAEGCELERLRNMAGAGAAEYTAELEGLYGKMLLKMETLSRLVEQSSAEVLKHENRNLMLRSKLAGLE